MGARGERRSRSITLAHDQRPQLGGATALRIGPSCSTARRRLRDTDSMAALGPFPPRHRAKWAALRAHLGPENHAREASPTWEEWRKPQSWMETEERTLQATEKEARS